MRKENDWMYEFDELGHRLQQAMQIAQKYKRDFGADFVAKIEELHFEEVRTRKAKMLEERYMPLFRQYLPANNDFTLLFGFDSDDIEANPSRIIAESIERNFYREKQYDPDTVDMDRLVKVFAAECVAG